MAYQLKITLMGIQPPIWRRVLLEPTMTMEELHYVTQTLYDWFGDQVFYFKKGERRIIDPNEDGDEHDEFASDILVGQAFRKIGDKWTYHYDMEDRWEMEVILEEIKDTPNGIELPVCTDGARNTPPDSCGGVAAHLNWLAVLKNPKDPEYPEAEEMYGSDFNPEFFDLEGINNDFRNPDNWDEDDDADYDD